MELRQIALVARDLEPVVDLGIRVAWEVTLDNMSTVHLHPRDLGGAILSFDQPHPPGWRRQRLDRWNPFRST